MFLVWFLHFLLETLSTINNLKILTTQNPEQPEQPQDLHTLKNQKNVHTFIEAQTTKNSSVTGTGFHGARHRSVHLNPVPSTVVGTSRIYLPDAGRPTELGVKS